MFLHIIHTLLPDISFWLFYVIIALYQYFLCFSTYHKVFWQKLKQCILLFNADIINLPEINQNNRLYFDLGWCINLLFNLYSTTWFAFHKICLVLYYLKHNLMDVMFYGLFLKQFIVMLIKWPLIYNQECNNLLYIIIIDCYTISKLQ